MENRKIDRLFEEKLVRHELEPSEEAWEQLKHKLDNKQKPKAWLQIAAAILVVAVSSIFLMKGSSSEQPSGTMVAGKYDHPMLQKETDWQLPVPEVTNIKEKRTEAVRTSKTEEEKPLFVKNEMIPFEQENIEKIDRIDLVSGSELISMQPNEAFANLANEEPSRLESQLESLPQLQVQITYKASDVQESKQDKTKIGQLWAKALQIKPGDVLADIRETKNDFFKGKKN